MYVQARCIAYVEFSEIIVVCISSSRALCSPLATSCCTARVAVRFSVCFSLYCALALSCAHCMELVEGKHQLLQTAHNEHAPARSKMRCSTKCTCKFCVLCARVQDWQAPSCTAAQAVIVLHKRQLNAARWDAGVSVARPVLQIQPSADDGVC
jgi:hypothetical protein